MNREGFLQEIYAFFRNTVMDNDGIPYRAKTPSE
jgi:hypothetical protein